MISIKNKSFSITAEIVVPKGGAEGVIIHPGGHFGGWSLYAENGEAKFAYNLFAVEITHVGAERPIATGKHQVRREFAYDGGGLGKGGTVSLRYDGERVGTGRVERTVAFASSADETTDVGRVTGTPVTDDYGLKSSAFTGTIDWVQIETGKDDHDHLISPEDRPHAAMTRQ